MPESFSGATVTLSSRLPSPIGPRGNSTSPRCNWPVRLTTLTKANNSSLTTRFSRRIPSVPIPFDWWIGTSPRSSTNESASRAPKVANKISGNNFGSSEISASPLFRRNFIAPSYGKYLYFFTRISPLTNCSPIRQHTFTQESTHR